jgi:YesN/AraC family two-component response regulator
MVRNFCRAIREIRENKYSARVQSTLYFLNHNYQNSISFSELSADLNVSENRLISSFKKEMGTTPNAYLTKIRMQNAAHLLINGSMSVSDVSNAVGISDSNYFVKLFKKEFGETPTVYRKRHTN